MDKTDCFIPPPKPQPQTAYRRRSSVMLLSVLCSFSVSVVKQKLNFFSPSTYRKCSIPVPEYVAAFLASNYYYLNFGKALTKAMPFLAACLKRSASCFRAAIVVNFCQEIFLARCEFLTRKTKTSRTDCCKSWTPATTYPAEEILSFTLEQPLGSSTLATKGALLAQRIFLPLFV